MAISMAPRIAPQKVGWIGVDIGTSTVKVAQVARGKQGWRVVASAAVARTRNWPADLSMVSAAVSSLDEMRAARSLQNGYRGRRVATTLPMALCDVHRIERSLENEPHANQIIRKSIETATQRSADDLEFDCWSAPAAGKQAGWTQALAVSRSWTDQLCEDIAQAGWSCEAIDGMPMTLARAVNMVQSGKPSAPLAALDWGSGRATLCMVESGQPSYVRCLKDCGFQSVLRALMGNLNLSEIEAQSLLAEHGFSANPGQDSDEIAGLIQEVTAEPMQQLIEEIKRSIAHYRYLSRVPEPQCLYLLGGGALVRKLDEHLSAQLELKTQVWQLPQFKPAHPASNGSQADCQFATAIALSALAWEAP